MDTVSVDLRSSSRASTIDFSRSAFEREIDWLLRLNPRRPAVDVARSVDHSSSAVAAVLPPMFVAAFGGADANECIWALWDLCANDDHEDEEEGKARRKTRRRSPETTAMLISRGLHPWFTDDDVKVPLPWVGFFATRGHVSEAFGTAALPPLVSRSLVVARVFYSFVVCRAFSMGKTPTP